LLFGYQPPVIPVSLNNSVEHFVAGAKGATPDHIRFFTLRSLKELLKIHNFEILEIKGSYAMLHQNMRFKRLFKAVDKFFTLFPSLSHRVVILCRKGHSFNNS